MEHCSGWHAVNRISTSAGVQCPDLLNATKMRHLISTLYAALDVPQQDRELFFKHMGHSANVNNSIYQAPLSIQEITRVGKHLETIDEGMFGMLCMIGFVLNSELPYDHSKFLSVEKLFLSSQDFQEPGGTNTSKL